jgi:hypothetical protein
MNRAATVLERDEVHGTLFPPAAPGVQGDL